MDKKTDVPQGQILNIPEIIRITEERHNAQKPAAPEKTKTEVSMAALGFTQPATIDQINEAAVRLGYDPLPEKLIAANQGRLFMTNHAFVLFK